MCFVFSGICARAAEKAPEAAAAADSILLRMHFRVSRSDIDTTYRDNAAQLRRFVDAVRAIADTPQASLPTCYVWAAASIEGRTAFNQRLSEARSRALSRYLTSRLGLSAPVAVHNYGEDWQEFRRLLRADDGLTAEQRDAVLSLIDRVPDLGAAEVKRRLRTLDGGRLWDHFLNHQFLHMRHATVRLESGFNLEGALDVPAVPPARPFPDGDVSALRPPYVSPSWDISRVAPLSFPTQQPARPVRTPLLSVKTNLLYDLFWIKKTGFQPVLNVEAEWYTRGGRWSVLVEYEFPWWSNESRKTFFQMQNWQLEPRFYLKPDHWFNGHYLSAYVMVNRYDFALKHKNGHGYQGEGLGIGLGYGYVLPLGRYTSRWKLEFLVKVGYYETHYDPYDPGNPFNDRYYYHWFDSPFKFRRRNHRFRYFGPTGVGVTLSYDLLRRKTR